MRSKSLIFSILLLLSCAVVSAQPIVDLALEIAIEPEGPLEPGTVGTMTFTFTNLGPDPPPASGLWNIEAYSQHPFDLEYGSDIVMVDTSTNENCWFSSDLTDSDPLYLYFWFILLNDTFPPGSSQTCETAFYINPDVPGSFELNWISYLGATDPDPTNNNIATPFIIAAPAAIPTLSQAGLVLLAFVLLSMGLILMNRQRRPH